MTQTKKPLIAAILATGMLYAQTLPTVPGTPQRVHLDFDVGTDIDDAHSLAILLRLRQLGYFNIIGITISTWQDKAAAFTNLMLAHGGLTTADIPIGAYKGAGTASGQSCSNDATDNYPNETLAFFLANSITPNVPNVSRTTFPDALAVLRASLANSPDASVIIITNGGLTNISALMQSPANSGGDGFASGQTLWDTKVIKMAGQLSGFPGSPYTQSPYSQSPGYNVGCDLTAAKYVFEHNGAVPIVGSPLQVTLRIGGCYDGSGSGCTASLPTNSPVRKAVDYFRSHGGSYTTGLYFGTTVFGASAWDPANAFYSLVGLTTPPGSSSAYYTQSANGTFSVVVSPAQSTWSTSTSLNHYFNINTSNWTGEELQLDTLLMDDYVPSSPSAPRSQTAGRVSLSGAGKIQ